MRTEKISLRKDQRWKTWSALSGARKCRHCAAEYLALTKEPNTMPEVSARYLRIAERHSELAETEATKRGETNQRYPSTRTESISIAVTEALKRCASTVVDFDGKLKDWRKNALRDLEAPPHWPRPSGIGYELRTPAAARASCPSRLVPAGSGQL
jgi:hypothetical protein